MHDDIDHDCDTESRMNPFFCITLGTRLAAMAMELLTSGARYTLYTYPKHVGDHVVSAALALPDIVEAPPCEAFRRRLLVGITPQVSELHARTWGDHGELFELPLGWVFQDNMIQSKAAADLIIIITYDADNLPNPWEWQLHEPAPGADDEPKTEWAPTFVPWEQVPSTDDKPRAGWAPTLIAAMTRSATAAKLHLDDRRAAGGA